MCLDGFMKEKVLYIEPLTGVSGDMFAGSLLGLIEDREHIFKSLKSLSIGDLFTVEYKHVVKGGIAAGKFNVILKEYGVNHDYGRTLSEIIEIINTGHKISSKAKQLAIKIFNRLATAEARVHGSNTDKVHFHEVGAIDSIVDILVSSMAITSIKADLVVSLPVSVGRGRICSAHGILPVPAPATAELLKNIPIDYTNIEGELTTPTGAAILGEVCQHWDKNISGKLINCAYGAGTKELPDRPNVLRISLLEKEKNSYLSDHVAVIETNIDDMSGELFSHIGNGLLEVGSLDFCIIPITMKKSRQGYILQVICPPEKVQEITDFIFDNTTSIGVRCRIEQRNILDRKIVSCDTTYGKIRVKLSLDKDGNVLKFKPEYDDVLDAAKKHNLTFIKVYNKILTEISSKY